VPRRKLGVGGSAANLLPPAPHPRGAACPLPQVVHRLGRHFGFQAFNLDPRSEVRRRHCRCRCCAALLGTGHLCAPTAAAGTPPLPLPQAAPGTLRHTHLRPASCCPCPQAKEPVYIPATIFLVTDHLYHLLVKNYMRRDKASGGRALASPLPACGRCGRRHAAAADVVESSSCCCLKCMGYLLGMPHSRPDAAFMLAKCACQPQRCVLPLTRAQPIHMCSRAAAPGRHG
jgi:hypothetical protein